MAKLCLKCSENIPSKIWIDGKKRNLQKRSYCLNCSPFGSKNTRKLHLKKGRKLCADCNAPTTRSFCHSCYQRKKIIRIADKVYGIIGESCWLCNYNKGREMLDLHHVDPEQKCFGITTREMANLSWKRVWNEIKKCMLLCCRCHREVEYGYRDLEEVHKIYEEKWKVIADMV